MMAKAEPGLTPARTSFGNDATAGSSTVPRICVTALYLDEAAQLAGNSKKTDRAMNVLEEH